jgi:hypothetical protein
LPASSERHFGLSPLHAESSGWRQQASRASIAGSVAAIGPRAPDFFPPARETQAKAFPSAHYFGKTYFG